MSNAEMYFAGDNKKFVWFGFRPILKCKKHPKYRGKGRPRTACEQCWRLRFHVKGEML